MAPEEVDRTPEDQLRWLDEQERAWERARLRVAGRPPRAPLVTARHPDSVPIKEFWAEWYGGRKERVPEDER